jgi:hypothetical protein
MGRTAMSFVHKSPLVLIAISFLPLGCSGKPSADPEMTRRNTDLGAVYEIYSQYVKANQRPPKQLSDLTQRQYQGIYPEGVRALQSGDYIVVWGVNLDKSASTVLAYEKNAPKQGGAVLLTNGSVEKMSADQLNAALKAKG